MDLKSLNLPTLADMEADRRGKPFLKGPSLMELGEDAHRLTLVDEKAFRAAVLKRDGYICRCCGKKVIKTLARVPLQLHIHHIHGRVGALAFEPRSAIVLCRRDHERVTGTINDKLIIVPSKTFSLDTVTLRGIALTNADWPVSFEKVA